MKNKTDRKFRVLFVYPNTMMATLLPINISLLNACLQREGIDTKLFDTTFYHTEEINFEQKKVQLLQIKKFSYQDTGVKFKETNIFDDLNTMIAEYQPDLIAFTIVQDTLNLTKDLVSHIRHWKIPTIAGGVAVTFSPEEILAIDGIDIICVGEGEGALVELCRKMSRQEDYSSVQNLYCKTPNGIVRNTIRDPVDLDSLPFINYDLFDKERIYRPMMGKIYAMLHVELDRGCPYFCAYCGAPELKKQYKEKTGCNYYRQKSTDRIIDEMKYLCDKYNPGYIDFDSETFLARPVPELKQFAERYKKEIKLPFWCQSRPETVTDEKIAILKDMGCKNLQFGVEQGNEEFRKKVLNRSHSNAQMLAALKTVEKYQIEYTVNNIIGFPGETRELVFDTIAINRLINPTTMNVYLFTPYKGTQLFDYCVENGYLDKDAEVHQLLDSTELKNQPLSYAELKGLQRTFPLYAKFPESDYDLIRRAEVFDDEGNRIFEELKAKFYEKVFKMNYK
ncbi:radical SAM protein [Methanoregula sp.]|uniref:B12-binding domain-containing radical SAM protein n=1 Tax=Methanoregula sp. TaxID=2052170 RepID=UPI00356A771E